MGRYTIDWGNCPPVEEYTDMGDTNGNKIDIGLEELDGGIIEIPEEKDWK